MISKFGRASNSISRSVWTYRWYSSHKCIKSKAALLVLVWSFSIALLNGLIFQPSNYVNIIPTPFLSVLYGSNAIVLLFYPLAGFLADNKFRRYETVFMSAQYLIIFWGALVATYFCVIWVISLFIEIDLWTITPAVVFLLPITTCYVMFNANIIQFGMDQLRDFPADYQNIFIHWYVWGNYTAMIINQFGWKMVFSDNSELISNNIGLYVIFMAFAISILLLFVSLCVAICHQRWFFIDSARKSPYKLVYKVTKFAYQHKVPIRRSAFTYCEDDIPSGLDLGKSKYSSPFTTEQVEDVMAFYGILKLLFAVGFTFFLSLPCDPALTLYVRHISINDVIESSGNGDYIEEIKDYLLHNSILSSSIVILVFPLYMLAIRPLIHNYRPTILKTIGIGILLRVASVTCTFIVDTIVHATDNNLECMFGDVYDGDPYSSPVYPNAFLYIQYTTYSLSYMFIYISLYQFICAQSPHCMKGLLIGLSFAVEGLFNFIASALIIPFMYIHQSFPSCCMDYYLMNIVVGVVGVVLYVGVARKYKLRERDEPCHVRRFVEDYYSKIQQEENYDN